LDGPSGDAGGLAWSKISKASSFAQLSIAAGAMDRSSFITMASLPIKFWSVLLPVIDGAEAIVTSLLRAG